MNMVGSLDPVLVDAFEKLYERGYRFVSMEKIVIEREEGPSRVTTPVSNFSPFRRACSAIYG